LQRTAKFEKIKRKLSEKGLLNKFIIKEFIEERELLFGS